MVQVVISEDGLDLVRCGIFCCGNGHDGEGVWFRLDGVLLYSTIAGHTRGQEDQKCYAASLSQT
jgi:hypothetical protein